MRNPCAWLAAALLCGACAANPADHQPIGREAIDRPAARVAPRQRLGSTSIDRPASRVAPRQWLGSTSIDRPAARVAPRQWLGATSIATPPKQSCKPEAPIAVKLAAVPLGGDRYELRVQATPTSAVGAVELTLLAPGASFATAPRSRFGTTTVGQARTLVTEVTTTDRAPTFHAIARVPVDGIEMTRSALVTLGTAPAQVTRTYALPDGERAREVRP